MPPEAKRSLPDAPRPAHGLRIAATEDAAASLGPKVQPMLPLFSVVGLVETAAPKIVYEIAPEMVLALAHRGLGVLVICDGNGLRFEATGSTAPAAPAELA